MKQTMNSSPPVSPSIDQANTTDFVVGMGANLGDRRAALDQALSAAAALGTVQATSNVYETDPVGGPPQPPFLNAAFRLRTSLEPCELWRALVAIEQRAGRVRRVRWGPRTLDLDLLWSSGQAVKTHFLEVPHPRLADRAFALVPLLEVAPDAREPASGIGYAELLQRLPATRLRCLGRLSFSPPTSTPISAARSA